MYQKKKCLETIFSSTFKSWNKMHWNNPLTMWRQLETFLFDLNWSNWRNDSLASSLSIWCNFRYFLRLKWSGLRMEHLLLKYDLFYFLFSIWSMVSLKHKQNDSIWNKHHLKFYLFIPAAFILHLKRQVVKRW